MNQLALWGLQAAMDEPLPTPTDPAFNPADVTPGPIGFIFTAVFMVAVGLLVMSMMTKMSRVNARYQVREELEREEAARQAAEQDASGAESAEGAEQREPDTTDGESQR